MSEPATLGQRLKAAREKQGLSAQKAADELHLDGWVVEALESGDYSRIGPSVYAKGHLKHYAALLGMPAADLLEGYVAPAGAVPDAPSAAARLPASMRMPAASATGGDVPWPQILGFAAVALAIAGVLLWKPWHPRVSPATATAAQVGEAPRGGMPGTAGSGDAGRGRGATSGGAGGPGVGAGGTADSGAVAGAAAAPGAGTAPGGGSTPATASAAGSDADSAAGVGRARLRLIFSADSWVDVHDAAGQRVFAGTGHVNNVRTIAGSAPLRVYIKSASSVHMDINNHSVAIEPKFVVDNVARFEAGADGVLRREPRAPGAAPRPPG